MQGHVLPANLEDLPMLSLPLLRSMQFLDSMRGQRGIMLPEGLLHRGKHCRVTEGSITITFPIDLMPAWHQAATQQNPYVQLRLLNLQAVIRILQPTA